MACPVAQGHLLTQKWCSRRESNPEPWDWESPVYAIADSQPSGHLRTTADDHGICCRTIELRRTPVVVSGCQARGLQNRLMVVHGRSPKIAFVRQRLSPGPDDSQ
jgi:hypothetical protein